jgi:hypothetical protein
MTIEYASLTEVWGPDAAPPSAREAARKRSSRRPPPPPAPAASVPSETAAACRLPPSAASGGSSLPPPPTATEPHCALYQGHMDNIMDAYLAAGEAGAGEEPAEDVYAKYARTTAYDAHAIAPMPACRERSNLRHLTVEPEAPPPSRRRRPPPPGATEAAYAVRAPYNPNAEAAPPSSYYDRPDAYYAYDEYYDHDLATLRGIQQEEKAAAAAAQAPESQAQAHRAALEPYPGTTTMDLVAYTLSGILLIFIMEQFLRIGVNMR